MKALWLALRSTLWALLLPGVVAGYVPWRFFGLDDVRFEARNVHHWEGAVLIALGTVLLVACIREFARRGRGTLSPADPPRKLVVQGLYRYVRNPMYLAVSLILIGEHILAHSRELLVYWAIWFAIVNVFVMAVEEPALRRQFGESYEQYAREVGRWIPKFAARTARRGQSFS